LYVIVRPRAIIVYREPRTRESRKGAARSTIAGREGPGEYMPFPAED
jgi:hypothetical protein